MVKSIIQNEKGFSSLEAAILMIVFTLMVSFTLGAFGIIHTGILHSISARNYAFETFRHRANLTYLRDADRTGKSGSVEYLSHNSFRLHAILDENLSVQSNKNEPSQRPITKARETAEIQRNETAHDNIRNDNVLSNPGERYGKNNEDGVNPVWIKVSYGICMNAAC